MIETEALILVKNYLQSHGFTSVQISQTKLPKGKKSPDLEVRRGEKSAFYCELKTPNLLTNPQTGMFHWTTTLSKLRGFIHTAIKQFEDYDPKHSLPWVLVFTSDHFQLNWTNFCHCIQGVVAYNGQVIKDLSNARFIKETNKDVLSMEIILWFQVNPKEKKIYQMKHFVNQQSQLFNEAKRISDSLTPYESEKITN